MGEISSSQLVTEAGDTPEKIFDPYDDTDNKNVNHVKVQTLIPNLVSLPNYLISLETHRT